MKHKTQQFLADTQGRPNTLRHHYDTTVRTNAKSSPRKLRNEKITCPKGSPEKAMKQIAELLGSRTIQVN